MGVVDKFLEHSRIMVLANGGHPKYFISSADLMIRNFDHRFEVACPIYAEDIRKELISMLQTQLKDNVKARLINTPELNEYKKPTIGGKPLRSQFELYNYFKKIEKNELDEEIL